MSQAIPGWAFMKKKIIFAAMAVSAAWMVFGCAQETRYKTLSFFFDGVPPPVADEPAPEKEVKVEGVDTNKPVQYREHGPYASRLCSACHEGGFSNKLLYPKEDLCFYCHKIDMSAKYVHGPVAGGGCLVCHNPHGSPYPFLLVSESKDFCLYCHSRKDIMKNEVHQNSEESCTVCHDAHSSDVKYLLK